MSRLRPFFPGGGDPSLAGKSFSLADFKAGRDKVAAAA